MACGDPAAGQGYSAERGGAEHQVIWRDVVTHRERPHRTLTTCDHRPGVPQSRSPHRRQPGCGTIDVKHPLKSGGRQRLAVPECDDDAGSTKAEGLCDSSCHDSCQDLLDEFEYIVQLVGFEATALAQADDQLAQRDLVGRASAFATRLKVEIRSDPVSVEARGVASEVPERRPARGARTIPHGAQANRVVTCGDGANRSMPRGRRSATRVRRVTARGCSARRRTPTRSGTPC